MKKYLVTYTTNSKQTNTPNNEQMTSWARRAGNAVVDPGSPLTNVSGNNRIAGYTIFQADSPQKLETLLKDHPYRKVPGATIDVFEFNTSSSNN